MGKFYKCLLFFCEMSKKFLVLFIGIFVFLVLIVVGLGIGGSFLEFSVFNLGSDGVGLFEIRNPVLGLSDEEAIDAFDEEFVAFLLYSIDAHKLRDAPISFEEPKIEIFVDEKVFNARVEEGAVIVESGGIDGEDVIVRTSAAEAVRMMRNREYIIESFKSGRLSVEFVASRAKLFGKGYLRVYDSVTG